MSRKKIALLGATGSIGHSAVEVLKANAEQFEVVLLVANTSQASLDAAGVALAVPEERRLLAENNQERLCQAIAESSADLVLNGIAGAAGLLPTLTALNAGIDVALANKESMVMAGKLVLETASKHGAQVIPVDSEHSALFLLLEAHKRENPTRLLITASGGPFRAYTREQLAGVTPEDALRHPTWKMGPKITVDSATLANKGLEVIEASALFGFPNDEITVLIHPQSVVHSLILTQSGAVYGQLSRPDMRLAISNALFWPFSPTPPAAPFALLDWTSLDLHFERCVEGRFPMLDLAREALKQGGLYPTAYNAANEVAVRAFLRGQLPFLDIFRITEYTLRKSFSGEAVSVERIFEADAAARQYAREGI
jgi:1-deoxy-D-xylulose-5-phosphate reductoisomerase